MGYDLDKQKRVVYMEKLALLNKLKIYDKNINIIVCLKEFDS